ncbi:unnamed protein product [Ranitomeya imitator]|uniref:UBA domain-containing protein n=1 Tax=Ranitomeya imitator TaxID=111125 RepID=A0ABN9M7Q7_9NEOB|nr:unnamed protein product [Ranitomeya imitator]
MFILVTSEDIAGSASHTSIQRCQRVISDEIKFQTFCSDQRCHSRILIAAVCQTQRYRYPGRCNVTDCYRYRSKVAQCEVSASRTVTAGRKVKAQPLCSAFTLRPAVTVLEADGKGPDGHQNATAEQIRLAQMIYDKNDADFEDKVKQSTSELQSGAACDRSMLAEIGIGHNRQLMEVTGKNQDECIVALHDCNGDVNRAINILLEGNSDTTSWETVGGKKKSIGKESSENKENREKRGDRETSRGRGTSNRRGRGGSRGREFRVEENGVDSGPGDRPADRGRRGRGRGFGGRGRGRGAGRFSAQGMGTFNPADYTEPSTNDSFGVKADVWETGQSDGDDGTGLSFTAFYKEHGEIQLKSGQQKTGMKMADKVRLRRRVKTRRGRHRYIGGLSTALQNAVDKPLLPLSETKVFTASSVPTENHITPGQSIDLVALLQKPQQNSEAGSAGFESTQQQNFGQALVFTNSQHSSQITPAASSATAISSFTPPSLSSVLGSGFGEIGSTKPTNSAGAQILEQLKNPGLGQFTTPSSQQSANTTASSSWDIKPVPQPSVLSQFGTSSDHDSDPESDGSLDLESPGYQSTIDNLIEAVNQSLQVDEEPATSSTDNSVSFKKTKHFKSQPEPSPVLSQLAQRQQHQIQPVTAPPPGLETFSSQAKLRETSPVDTSTNVSKMIQLPNLSLDSQAMSVQQTQQQKHLKPQKRRIPPTSKIPSSAVEMPGSADVTGLNVQFGALEFGSEPSLPEFGSNTSPDIGKPDTKQLVFKKYKAAISTAARINPASPSQQDRASQLTGGTGLWFFGAGPRGKLVGLWKTPHPSAADFCSFIKSGCLLQKTEFFQAISSLKEDGVIIPVPQSERFQGFYSNLFIVQKKDGTVRPILDLKLLNKFVRVRRFRMESFRSVIASMEKGEFLASIDIQDADSLNTSLPISSTVQEPSYTSPVIATSSHSSSTQSPSPVTISSSSSSSYDQTSVHNRIGYQSSMSASEVVPVTNGHNGIRAQVSLNTYECGELRVAPAQHNVLYGPHVCDEHHLFCSQPGQQYEHYEQLGPERSQCQCASGRCQQQNCSTCLFRQRHLTTASGPVVGTHSTPDFLLHSSEQQIAAM